MVDRVQLMNTGHFGKTLKKETTIAALAQPHIKNGQHPAIHAVSDQSPQSLLEADDGRRKLIVHEGIPSGCRETPY